MSVLTCKDVDDILCQIENDKKVFIWKQEAERGDADAQNKLGYFWFNIGNIKENDTMAFKYWYKAAVQGHADAQCNVASCYYYGQGVLQNYDDAFNWYLKAARQGDVYAQESLGKMYYIGLSVSQNNKNAYIWFRISILNEIEEESRYARDTAIYLKEKLKDNEIKEAEHTIKKIIDSKYTEVLL